jgi:guanosine-3',5'-bis(diphosphate) 3'-pyrophosphohydrolase
METAPKRPHIPSVNRTGTRLLVDSIAFAAYKHRLQRRKDPEASPYINHPIALAHVLCDEAGVRNVKTLAAAILHDTIEDTETTYEELRERFGRTIAGVVREVSDDKTLAKAERKRLQIEHASELSRRARLVKLADKICNVRDVASNPPHDWSLARRREYFDWAKAVVDKIRGTNKKLERAFDEACSGRP